MSAILEPDSVSKGRRISLSLRHFALLAILILAGFLRLWRLDSLPPGLHHDEAYNGLDALSVLGGETFPIFYEGWEVYAQEAHDNKPVYQSNFPVFFEGNYGREPLTIYLMAIVIGLIGPSPFVIRLIPAIAGLIAVLATYLAAQMLTDHTGKVSRTLPGSTGEIIGTITPFLAAFIMAISYPALTYSRYADRVMLFVPIEAFVVYFFWRGIKSSEKRSSTETQEGNIPPLPLGAFAPGWFVASGIFMGLAFYTFAAARFLPLLFIAFMALWFWRDHKVLRLQWANLSLMAAVSILVSLPLIVFLLRYPYFLIYRSRFVANRGAGTYPGQPWLTWTYNVGRVARGLFWQGDINLIHNYPGRPYLDPIQAILALAGLVSMIVRRFNRGNVFLLLWLLVMLLPGILSGDAPHFGRLIGIGPPLVIIISLGAVWLGQLLVRWFGNSNPSTALYVVIAIMLLFITSGVLATVDYFGRYAGHPELSSVFDSSDWQMGKYVDSLSKDSIVYLTPTQERMATIYFALQGQRDRLQSFFSPGDSLLPAGKPGIPAVFLIRPQADSIWQRLVELFPQGQVDNSVPDLLVLQIPGDVSRFTSGEPVESTWGGAITLRDWKAEQKDGRIEVMLTWQAIVEMARNYTVYVHILDEEGNLVAQLDRPPDGYPTSDWLPGEIVTDIYSIDLPEDLQPKSYFIQTGFYHLLSQERLGEPVLLGQIDIN